MCGCATGSGTGPDPYVIQGWDINASTSPGIEIKNTQSNFIITNVTIHDGLLNSTLNPGILLENVSNGIVRNTNTWNNNYGISLSDTTRTIVEKNTAHDNTQGIYMSGGTDNQIINNSAVNNAQYGIWITAQAAASTISNNNATANSSGIEVTGNSNNNLFERNIALNNKYYGFQIFGVSHDMFRYNNATGDAYGIVFYVSTHNSAIGNWVTGTIDGLGMENPGNSYNNLTQNIVTNNQVGIYLFDATNNTVYDNYMKNDGAGNINAYDNTLNNTWNVPKRLATNILGGPFQGGNYYSDYSSRDDDGDGIGDTPYSLSGGQALDNFPLVQPAPTTVHDVAVTSVTATPSSEKIGGNISVTVAVSNRGTGAENFVVSIFHNATLAGSQALTMPAWSNTTLDFSWNTNSVPPGTYAITANATRVPGETYTLNNISPPTFVRIEADVPPSARFTYNPTTNLLAGQTVTFDASQSYDPDGSITKYQWNFGDGHPGTDAKVPYSYAVAGTYNVSLMVVDDQRLSNTTWQQITIGANPPSQPTNLVVHATDAQATLTWTIPADNGGAQITGYKIYRGSSAENLTPLATIGDVATYTDKTVTAGETYYYAIAAINQEGREGQLSAEANVLVPQGTSPEKGGVIDNPTFWIVSSAAAVATIALGATVLRRRSKRSRSTDTNRG